MLLTDEMVAPAAQTAVKIETLCFHCGAPCIATGIAIEEKLFCCEGCKLVYEILNEHELCDYYTLQSHPGLNQVKPLRNDKYAYLDNEDVARPLFKFDDGRNAIVSFYIPGVHCSSCMWLLEHMHKLNAGVTESRLNFTSKEVTIHFVKEKISLRQLVELLSSIGYEPYISLDDSVKGDSKNYNKQKVYKLGVAGFCFGNIMMMSFPEYFSAKLGIDYEFALLFRYLNLVLSIPVFFFCASEFYISAWKGLKQRMLNIDAPIVLALLITYSRSIYEILSGTGSGYLDSMSGIVFFMLVGRVVQERTYRSMSFHRDYKSYFPIAVTVITATGTEARNLQDLKEDDIVQLYNEDIIPADARILKGNANIDYSFVTGESEPVKLHEGGLVYAGGKQVGEGLTIKVIKPVVSSYLTSLWNHHSFSKNKEAANNENSVVQVMSRYFTYVLFVLAGITAVYWAIHDPSKVLPSVSAMLIVACPCALLLSSTYTNGNLLRIFSNNGLFLRDASVIEQLGNIDHVVFDKTGTLTHEGHGFIFTGHQMTEQEKDWVYSLARQSKHPYSKALAARLGERQNVPLSGWKEIPGQGIQAYIHCNMVMVGSAPFVGVAAKEDEQATVYIRINNKVTLFHVWTEFRDAVPGMMKNLRRKYSLSLLSGDNNSQQPVLENLFGAGSELLFKQKPVDKLQYIERKQNDGSHVLMIGDGLNDAGALQQSNVGVTLADDVNSFTPSCDAILDAKKLASVPAMLRLAHWGKYVIGLSFTVSVLYNIVGLCVSVQGLMSPMIAAILMPVSTVSIVLITTGVSSLAAKYFRLSVGK